MYGHPALLSYSTTLAPQAPSGRGSRGMRNAKRPLCFDRHIKKSNVASGHDGGGSHGNVGVIQKLRGCDEIDVHARLLLF